MKRNAITKFVKDILLAAAAWGIAFFLINGMWGVNAGGAMEAATAGAIAMMFAGVPFGWRLASKIITATSIQGVGIKLLISAILGFFAVFIILIADTIGLVVHLVEAKRPVPAT